MMDWLITFVLVFLAYQLGYRNGWRTYEKTVMEALNRIAYKLDSSTSNSFWSSGDEN